jgi:hypothetical protein
VEEAEETIPEGAGAGVGAALAAGIAAEMAPHWAGTSLETAAMEGARPEGDTASLLAGTTPERVCSVDGAQKRATAVEVTQV